MRDVRVEVYKKCYQNTFLTLAAILFEVSSNFQLATAAQVDYLTPTQVVKSSNPCQTCLRLHQFSSKISRKKLMELKNKIYHQPLFVPVDTAWKKRALLG